jgi:hypothetical protein
MLSAAFPFTTSASDSDAAVAAVVWLEDTQSETTR